MTDERKKFAYDESIRSLSLQSVVLDDLRSRTGILLTAASLTATFVGSRALDAGFTTWTRLALGFFLATGGFCLGVLWPRGQWGFAFNARTILEGYIQRSDGATIDEMYVTLAEINQSNWEANADRLKWLFWSFRLAVLALVLQVPYWLIAIGSTHNG